MTLALGTITALVSRVKAATGAKGRRGARIDHAYDDRLALADRIDGAIEFGVRIELLGAVGTAYETHSKNGDKTEQQALQHAVFSRLWRRVRRSIPSGTTRRQ